MIAPTYATPSRPTPRRLLLVSYHFPPGTAVGGLRWQKLARYAVERGWGLDVITLDPADLVEHDPERLADLPHGVRVFGIPAARLRLETAGDRVWSVVRGWRRATTPRRTGTNSANADGRAVRQESRSRADATRAAPRLRDVARAWFAWLDYARGLQWASAAALRALEVFEPGRHQAVVTCGPPHMVHEAGCRIARATGLPLIVDLRDPWRLVQRLPESIASPLWYLLAAYYERRAIARAALVVTNTEPLERALVALYPDAARRIITVPNGCDEDHVAGLPPVTCRFLVAYAGTIYLDRDPRPLFRAAALVIRAQRLEPAEFGIELMGDVQQFDGAFVMGIAREEGVEQYVHLRPAGTRREALQFLSQAQLLVVLPQDSDLAVPAKIFDYMRCDAWVLALARRDSAVELLLRGSRADVLDPENVPGIARLFADRVAQFRRGDRPVRLSEDPRFCRRTMADRLFGAIETLPCVAS
ncbi:MAG TPA: glycosyltransferase [Gemmatimonadales bacterium]|nr:glycosyltransferase [Gemmatimonadales bacterium]